MAENSYWWTTGGAGDGSATYTRADLKIIAQILAACQYWEGVAPNFLDEFAYDDAVQETFEVGAGGALVDGKPYRNSATVTLTVAAAVGLGNSRIDRVVLRADWTAQTVRITLISGTNAASPVAPAITQTPGTTYDLPLYQVLVDVSGNLTTTDERTFAELPADSVTAGMLADGAVDSTAVLADSVVTAAKIANRTRRFMVGPTRREDPVGAGYAYLIYGALCENNQNTVIHGWFAVPNDFVSGMTAKAVVIALATGNVYVINTAAYGADGENYLTHSAGGTPAAISVSTDLRKVIASISLSSAAIGDLVALEFSRDATNVLDTVSGDVYFMGWLVEYTADS